MFERFTVNARRVLALAQEEARALGHGFLGDQHLLLGLFREEAGSAGAVLRAYGHAPEEARSAVEEAVGARHRSSGAIPFTPGAKKALEMSLRESLRLKHTFIGTGHILLALLDAQESAALEILARFGIEREDARARALEAISTRAEDVPPLRPVDAPGPVPVPPAVNTRTLRIAEELVQVRAAKDAALDAGDFAAAAQARDREKALLAERTDVVASVRPDREIPRRPPAE